MEKKDDTLYTIVSIGGVDYLTFPQALIFVDLKRATLQQRLNRERAKKEKDPNYKGELHIINIGKYNFVPYEVCKKLKDDKEIDIKADKIKELAMMDISLEEIQKLIEEKQKKLSKGKK